MALKPYLEAVCKHWRKTPRGGLPDRAGLWEVVWAPCISSLCEPLRGSIGSHWRRPPGVILVETWKICMSSWGIKARRGRVLRGLHAGGPGREEQAPTRDPFIVPARPDQ